MIQFACPGCAGEHEVEDSFAGYEAKCSHCGIAFEIPGNEPEDETEVQDEEQSANVARKSRTSASPRSSKSRVEVSPDISETTDEVPKFKKWVKDRRVQAGGGVALLLVVLVIMFSGGKKPAPPVTPVPTPVPAPVIAKKEEPKVAPLAPPVPPLEIPPAPALPPQGLTVARLTTELQQDPTAKSRYLGRALEVRGIVDQVPPDGLVLSSGTGTPTLTCRYHSLPPFQAVIGSMVQLPEPPLLSPGHPVIVQGVMRDGHMDGCEVVSITTLADREWLGKVVAVESVVQAIEPSKNTTLPSVLLLESPTDSRLRIEWAFKPSDSGSLSALLPGQLVKVRGTVGGRFKTVLRINDCQILPPDATAGPNTVATTVAALSREYQEDLIARPAQVVSGSPVSVTAVRLAEAFQTSVREATVQYGAVPLLVSGVIVERRDAEGMVFLETPTGSRFRMAAYFTPSRFKALSDHTNVQLRCTCSLVDNIIRLDNCEWIDPEGQNVQRTVAEYLPVQPGTSLRYETVQYGKGKDHVIRQIIMKFVEPDRLEVTQVKQGAFAGKSLFQENSPAVLWSKDARNANIPLFALKFRKQYDLIEIGRPSTPQAGDKDLYWDPILKIGMKAGQSWKTTEPDGREVTYTVAGFRKDRKDRDVVEIRRVSMHPKDFTGMREESVVVYARGVGELGRSVTLHVGASAPVLIREDKLIESGEAGENRLESLIPGK